MDNTLFIFLAAWYIVGVIYTLSIAIRKSGKVTLGDLPWCIVLGGLVGAGLFLIDFLTRISKHIPWEKTIWEHK